MDSLTPLKLQRPTQLAAELAPYQASSVNVLPKQPWIVFGTDLAPIFPKLAQLIAQPATFIDYWQLGDQQIALMSGDWDASWQASLVSLKIDFAQIKEAPSLYQAGLIVLDMDSTAIEIECIDEIAKLAGVGEEVSAVTERAMQGELDFEQSLRLRVSKLAGADVAILEQVRQQLPLMSGLTTLLTTLRHYGWKTAIASGGFSYFSDHLKRTLKLDYAQSNTLGIEGQQLTGQVLGEVVSAQKKADILCHLAQEYGIAANQTLAVGDGANDLLMMQAAGLGVAYHAKPKVEAQAQVAVRFNDLTAVLCVLSAGAVWAEYQQ